MKVRLNYEESGWVEAPYEWERKNWPEIELSAQLVHSWRLARKLYRSLEKEVERLARPQYEAEKKARSERWEKERKQREKEERERRKGLLAHGIAKAIQGLKQDKRNGRAFKIEPQFLNEQNEIVVDE